MTRLALCLLLLATLAGCNGELCFDASGKNCAQARASTCEWQARTDAAWPPSPHEQQPEPTPALAPGRWIDERYEL
ncbi:hypothetical protein [Pseudomonas cremoricolorata]|uniref:Lipoprotein n=1 Tax=Pseudomonas cremoricolorata TaxID=157783 RepID=A0A089WV73_9PSED|nr:hypothetical protein [Pseudomonas cremoricolorata]AIR90477.1 hypothetical protein LK03_14795 [Pseudomonas cremoricolorata]